jgi:hypothetical protein
VDPPDTRAPARCSIRDSGHRDGSIVRGAAGCGFPRREVAGRQMPVPPVCRQPSRGAAPARAARCQAGGAPGPVGAGAGGARRSLLRGVVLVGVWWQVCELVSNVIAF